MIARLAKGVLPANTQIQKDALLALHKSATVFVSYIASKYVYSPALAMRTMLFIGHRCLIYILCPTEWRDNSIMLISRDSSNDLAHIGGKKTISPQDVMSALKDAELEGFLPRLEGELKSTSRPLYSKHPANNA